MAMIRFLLADQDDIRIWKLGEMLDTGWDSVIREGELRMPNLRGSRKPGIEENGEAAW